MNRFKNIFRCLAATFIVVFSATSCLEKYPADAYREKEAMKTFQDAKQTLLGVYSAFMSSSLYSGTLTLGPDIQSDLVYAVDGYSNNYGTIWQWDILSTDRDVEGVYAALYKVIGRCNFYLDQVDALKATLTDDDEIEALDGYTGEIYCARALAYSELIKCFCKDYKGDEEAKNELGVVLRDSYFKEEVARRSSLYDSYQFVLKDLTAAEGLLDRENDLYNNVWFSQAAAYAIHARVALYMRNWDDAITYSSKLIDHPDRIFRLADANTLYTQDSEGNTWSYYQYLWDYDSSFEVIWKVGFTTTSYGGMLGAPFLNFTTDYTYYYPDYVPATWALNLYGASDLRLDSFFATLPTGYMHGLTWPLLVKYYGNRNFMASQLYHLNMPKPLRLSEQYLIRAEAYCRQDTPNYSLASKDLSQMRSYRMDGGNISLTASNWQQQISDERVRELFMEGFRLHDLKRWEKGFERTPQSNSLTEGSSLKVEADNPLFVWPIPRNEIEAPGSEVEKNESNR